VEWQDNNVPLAYHHLDACRWDLRGWEHRYLYTLFKSNQQTLKGNTGSVNSVAFSPDSNRIASGSANGTLKVWDAQTGQQTLTLQGHPGWVSSVAFSPDGKRLASASSDKTVKVWGAQTGQQTLTLMGHTDNVSSVAFSPDGKRLTSASGQRVQVWDVSPLREKAEAKSPAPKK